MNELEEISRLRGELSTCCAVLGLLINAVSMNNPDTLAAFRRRITDWPMDIVDDPYCGRESIVSRIDSWRASYVTMPDRFFAAISHSCKMDTSI